jgi:hypothetical protein
MKKQSLLLLVGAFGCLFTAVNPLSAQTWTQTSAPTDVWTSIACSADGSRLVAADATVNQIYTSTNYGTTWTQSGAPNTNWTCVASSADGTNLVATVDGGGIYTSTNSGAAWTLTSAPTNAWSSVASSADGSKLVAAVNGGGIYASTDSGVTWTPTSAANASWTCVASSADGTKLAAVSAGSPVLGGWPAVHISTNSGATWYTCLVVTAFPIGSSGHWSAVNLSADGTKLVVAENSSTWSGIQFPGLIYTSMNSGATWQSGPSGFYSSVACSADGSELVAASDGSIYTSIDSGITWKSNSVPTLDWSSVASSADGSELVAAVNGGGIYISQTTPAPVLNIAPSSNNLVFSWIVPSTNFVMQQNSNLLHTSNWTNVTNTPTLNPTNLRNQVILPLPTAGNDFYRLKTP